MDAELRSRLLASIEAQRLVIVLGAGLSMAPPSRLPSAAALAAECFDDYTATVDPECDPHLRSDLEALANYFVERQTLKTVFLNRLVPWDQFVRPPNIGHSAIADLLLTRCAASALSANYDFLIEHTAHNYGARFRGSVDGDEANVHAADHSPLLKFHGCSVRDPNETVWTKTQLEDGVISKRIAKSVTWMSANLREKDLLVVGFWTDWSYFNQILGNAFVDVLPLSVTLVDPADAAVLTEKAPDLWALAHKEGVMFAHVQESGAAVLDEVRKSFSRGYLRRLLNAGVQSIENETNSPCDPAWLEMADFDSESLYGLRRDAEGVPASRPATLRHPGTVDLLGFFHLLLRRAGAAQVADGYEFAGQRVRVVNGAGAILSRLRAGFLEAPVLPSGDIVVAVGATDLGVPGNIVRTGRPGDIIRPAPQANWVEFQEARRMLKV